ncbi:MAG: type I deoxyribonuclease HsdR [Planctomycetaceae bacterium]|nr:MAG: type I deoxyribonuclease HsdR [Planctomycetaceae bacterium]
MPTSLRWLSSLNDPCDGISLCCFRLLLGIVLSVDLSLNLQQIEERFPYWEFRPPFVPVRFLEDWPNVPAKPCLMLGLLGAVLLTLGIHTRWAAWGTAGCYFLLYLWDPTQFNNHHYLIVLLCMLMGWVRADHECHARFWESRNPMCIWIPQWQLFLFYFQLGVVYFYGAINKLNPDWIRGEPLSLWLAVEQERPFVGPWLAHHSTKYVFAWGGILFDACAIPLLLIKSTRWLGMVLSVFFHYTNSWLFQIGPFPWLMMSTLVLFIDPAILRKHGQRWHALLGISFHHGQVSREEQAQRRVRHQRLENHKLILLTGFVLFQGLFPLRCWILSTDPEWTEEGKNFSWRMMLSHKDCFVLVRVIDQADGRLWVVDQTRYLTRRQVRGKGVWGNPRHLAAFARFIRREAKQRGFVKPRVIVQALASLNGRPYQYLVDPTIDLSLAEEPFWKLPDWVMPCDRSHPPGNYSLLEPETRKQILTSILSRTDLNSNRR